MEIQAAVEVVEEREEIKEVEVEAMEEEHQVQGAEEHLDLDQVVEEDREMQLVVNRVHPEDSLLMVKVLEEVALLHPALVVEQAVGQEDLLVLQAQEVDSPLIKILLAREAQAGHLVPEVVPLTEDLLVLPDQEVASHLIKMLLEEVAQVDHPDPEGVLQIQGDLLLEDQLDPEDRHQGEGKVEVPLLRPVMVPLVALKVDHKVDHREDPLEMDLRELVLQDLVVKDHLEILSEQILVMVHQVQEVKEASVAQIQAKEDLVVPTLGKVDSVVPTLDKVVLEDQTLQTLAMVLQEVDLAQIVLGLVLIQEMQEISIWR